MTEMLASLLAGIGMFFTGVKMIGTNLRHMTTRRIRLLVSKWAGNRWIAGLIGAAIHLITQSGPAMVFLIISMISTGLLTTRKALPMLICANAGGALLVLFAIMDIQLLILIILGIAGISYYLEKPSRYQSLAAVLLGMGFLFFGLKWIQTSAAPLTEYEWFKAAIFHTKGSNFFALAVGAILSFIVQSSAAVTVVAIAMTEAGVLPMDQTIMLIYGTHIGSSLVVTFLSTGLKGTTKQIAMAQVTFNSLTCIVFIVLFFIETRSGVPLVKALVAGMTDKIDKQMAYVYFLFNFGGAVIFSFLVDPFHRFLTHLWPATEEENKSKVKYIHDQALQEPETAMDVAEKEQERLTELISDHFAWIRNAVFSGQSASGNNNNTHAIFNTLSGEIQGFLHDLTQKNLNGETSERLLNIMNRQNLIASLEENVDQLAQSLSRSSNSPALKPLTQNLMEGLETILFHTLDVMKTRDSVGLSLLASITGDRGKMMESIRNEYLNNEQSLRQHEKSELLYITNLFERSVWIMGRLGNMIESGARYSVLKK